MTTREDRLFQELKYDFHKLVDPESFFEFRSKNLVWWDDLMKKNPTQEEVYDSYFKKFWGLLDSVDE